MASDDISDVFDYLGQRQPLASRRLTALPSESGSSGGGVAGGLVTGATAAPLSQGTPSGGGTDTLISGRVAFPRLGGPGRAGGTGPSTALQFAQGLRLGGDALKLFDFADQAFATPGTVPQSMIFEDAPTGPPEFSPSRGFAAPPPTDIPLGAGGLDAASSAEGAALPVSGAAEAAGAGGGSSIGQVLPYVGAASSLANIADIAGNANLNDSQKAAAATAQALAFASNFAIPGIGAVIGGLSMPIIESLGASKDWRAFAGKVAQSQSSAGGAVQRLIADMQGATTQGELARAVANYNERLGVAFSGSSQGVPTFADTGQGDDFTLRIPFGTTARVHGQQIAPADIDWSGGVGQIQQAVNALRGRLPVGDYVSVRGTGLSPYDLPGARQTLNELLGRPATDAEFAPLAEQLKQQPGASPSELAVNYFATMPQ